MKARRSEIGRIAVLGLMLLQTGPVRAAQPAGKVARIGVLLFGAPSTDPNLCAFLAGLGDLGYVEGADVTVVAYEKVTVPAGEFDAFKLTAKESLSGTSPINSQYAGEITRTYWYAPAARAVVRVISHNPYLGPSTVELVAFELRP